jgi:predicted DsbA family dithiol-disulfide isomerase
MCPFCYIGKRHFEKALKQFEGRDEITVTWKSFQLDPTISAAPGTSVYDYLAERKGMSREQSVQMHARVTEMAKAAGLNYDFDRAVIANSFNAHRFAHYAASKGLQDAAEEALFSAYFTLGKDIGNTETLVQIGESIGLEAEETYNVLNSDRFSAEVRMDITEAQELGARGVPFFVIDRKYGISGAQPVETFIQVLEKAKNG